MRRLKALGLVLLAVVVVGVMTAAAASAESTPLPDIHTALPGEKYPLLLAGLNITPNLLRTEGGTLTGTEVSISLSVKELTSLGEAVIVYFGIEEPVEKAKCKTAGAANDEVVVPNAEFHLVYSALSPSELLEIAGLILFSRFTETCGLIELNITGPATMRVNVPTPGVGKEGDSTSLEIRSRCATITTDEQEIPYYYNDALEKVPTTLLANIAGTGLKKACELIEATTLLVPETGSSATMFSVLF